MQGTQACDPAIFWTTSKGLRPFVRCLCLHFACLVTFSWMRSQHAIQRLRSGFHEPKTSHAHEKMLWHRWFHPKTVDRSVLLAFTLLLIVLAMQHSRGESHAPKTLYTRHPRFPKHFSCHNICVSPGWRIPTHSQHSTRFRYFCAEFKAPNHRVRSS
jgi:hypothetical protein